MGVHQSALLLFLFSGTFLIRVFCTKQEQQKALRQAMQQQQATAPTAAGGGLSPAHPPTDIASPQQGGVMGVPMQQHPGAPMPMAGQQQPHGFVNQGNWVL